jgi:c-di-GMP-related signal transduction protein
MLESKLGDFFIEMRQVLEKLLDHYGIEVNSRAAKQQRRCFVHRHAATKRSILTNRVETIDNRNYARRNGNLFAT